MRKKIVRITTVPVSLKVLLKGQLKFIQQFYDVIAVSSFGDDLLDVKLREGVGIFPVEMSRNISPLKDLISIYRLYRFLKAESPHIVHTHTPKAGFVGMFAAYLAKVPNRFHTVAGLPLTETHGIKRMILILVERFTYSLAHLVLPNSIGLKNFILSNKLISEHKILVLGSGSSNGIDLNFFKTSESIKEQSRNLKFNLGLENRFVFLFIGRIVSHKGINELLKSFIDLSHKYPPAALILVGDFENDLDPISDVSIQYLKNNSIFHVGYKTDVRPYLELADVFVFPSYREGFPNVVLQACAFNLPCIVSDISGCNEIIENLVNGLLVQPRSENELLQAMQILYSNSDLRQSMCENNRNHIEMAYNQELIWQKYLDLYNSVN